MPTEGEQMEPELEGRVNNIFLLQEALNSQCLHLLETFPCVLLPRQRPLSTKELQTKHMCGKKVQILTNKAEF